VISFAIHVARLDWVGPMIEVGVGVGGRVYQVRPTQRCSMGFKSGDFESLDNTIMVTLAV